MQIGTTTSKNVLYLLVGIVVLLLLVVVLGQRGVRGPGQEDEEGLSRPSALERTINQDARTLLQSFPADFPREEGVRYLNSFIYVPANSVEQQLTLEYVSGKSLAENFLSFKNFLAAQGYTITNEISEGDRGFYYANKAGNDLILKFDLENNQVKVNATYVKR